MTFCEPVGLVGLATFVEARLDEGRRVIVTGPSDSNVANYLSRMRVGRLLDSLGAEHDLAPVREWPVGDALIELESFDGVRGAERLAKLVHAAAEIIDVEIANALYIALCEIGMNVPHHSGRQRGFMAAQWLHRRTQLHFAVGDAGSGMLATLRGHGATTDCEALELALDPAVSRTGFSTRGLGLPDVVQCVTDLEGSLHLASGGGYLRVANGQQSLRTYGQRVGGSLIQGTVKIV
jgi:hypothetical protein